MLSTIKKGDGVSSGVGQEKKGVPLFDEPRSRGYRNVSFAEDKDEYEAGSKSGTSSYDFKRLYELVVFFSRRLTPRRRGLLLQGANMSHCLMKMRTRGQVL